VQALAHSVEAGRIGINEIEAGKHPACVPGHPKRQHRIPPYQMNFISI